MKHLKTFLLITALSVMGSAVAIDIKFLKKERVVIDGITYQVNVKKSSATVVKGQEDYTGDVVIPEKIDKDSLTLYVEAIGNEAFEDCAGLTSVDIPRTVTAIGDQAFKGCSSLTSITLPKGLTELSAELFRDCSSLTDVTLPDGLRRMEDGVFAGCKSLESITLPQASTSCQPIPSRVAVTSPTYRCRQACGA